MGNLLAAVSDVVELGFLAVVVISVLGLAYGDMLKIPLVRAGLVAFAVAIPALFALKRVTK